MNNNISFGPTIGCIRDHDIKYLLRRQPANTLCHGPADPWRWADNNKTNTMWPPIITGIISILFIISGIVIYLNYKSKLKWKQSEAFFVGFQSSNDVMTTKICYKDNAGDFVNYQFNGGSTKFSKLKSGEKVQIVYNGDIVEMVEMIKIGILFGKILIGIGLVCAIFIPLTYRYPNGITLF